MNQAIREELAELSHDIWRDCVTKISDQLDIPYYVLPETMKDINRDRADRMIDIMLRGIEHESP